VVRGEPGIGKSALLVYARQRAALMMVLSSGGVQDESDLAFAGLHELLRPVLSYLGELPDTQSRALAGALGLAPSAHADRLLISAAVLGLLAVAAEDHPALCVVDDAHWVDRPSADALVFTARRLRAERLAILFGAREGELSRFEAAGLAELTLLGLDQESAAAVLAARAHDAAPSVRERLLSEAGGNPLALVELAGGLSQVVDPWRGRDRRPARHVRGRGRGRRTGLPGQLADGAERPAGLRGHRRRHRAAGPGTRAPHADHHP
jgi:hypothetical protein